MIFNLYIFNKHCDCIYYKEWLRPNPAKMSESEERKLVYGLIFSLKNFCQKLSPDPQNDGFLGYKTSAYKLHYFETPTGLKFVLHTDPNVGSMREVLRQIYTQVYVEYVTKNPLAMMDQEIKNELFEKNLDVFVKGLNVFN